MRHLISILLQNESGALARVASMFASRGFNIESLSVAPTDDETVSRLTLVTTGTESVVQQINKQLAKLIDVVAIADRTDSDDFERELALLKFAVAPERRASFSEHLGRYGARILDDHPAHLTIEVVGDERTVDAFLEGVPEGAELVSVVRSGPMVIGRGERSLF